MPHDDVGYQRAYPPVVPDPTLRAAIVAFYRSLLADNLPDDLVADLTRLYAHAVLRVGPLPARSPAPVTTVDPLDALRVWYPQ